MEILRAEAEKDSFVKVLSLSRNFGHQVAISAGLDHAAGDAVATMDADLQDPPEILPEMLAKWAEGNDAVYARRSIREGEGLLKRVTAKIFYRLLSWIARVSIPQDTGDFRLMSRRMVLALRGMQERHRFVRGMSAWVGFKQAVVDYERPPRFAGDTKYGLAKMLRLATDGIVSFSWAPLRLAIYVGLVAIAICATHLVVQLVLWVFTDRILPGWMSLATLITFLGSLQLLMIGIMGEYVGRILDEVKARPLYLIQETINLNPTGNTREKGSGAGQFQNTRGRQEPRQSVERS